MAQEPYQTKSLLTDSRVVSGKIEEHKIVDKAMAPDIYEKLVVDEYLIPKNLTISLKDGEDVETKVGNDKVWSEALSLGDGGGGDSDPVEVGSGVHIDGDGKVALGLDTSTIGTTNDGSLTENLYLIKGDVSTGEISSLQIADIVNITSGSDFDNYASLELNKNGGSGFTKRVDGEVQSIFFESPPDDTYPMLVTDEISEKGIQYAENYFVNGSLDDRWIPDWGAVKTYVDEGLGEKLDIGTGTQSATTYRRGDGTWATPTNTTYTAITEAEFNTGTATTARAVSAVSLNRDIQAKVISYLTSLDGFEEGAVLTATATGFEWVLPE